MKITNIYLEEVICMKVEGFDRTIFLENHADNRALLAAFAEQQKEKYEEYLDYEMKASSTESTVEEPEYTEADYWDGDDTHHINHGC